MRTLTILLATALTCALLPDTASAWMHANRWGGASSGGWGSTTRTDAWGGSMTHDWGEGTTMTNRFGDTATHVQGSGETTFSNPWGGSAVHNYGEGTTWNGRYGGSVQTDAVASHPYGYYAGAYRPYYPPAAVNHYVAGCPNCGWGAAAAGAAVGLAAGAAAGATYASPPADCVSPGGMGVVYNCGGSLVRPFYGANGVSYGVAPSP